MAGVAPLVASNTISYTLVRLGIPLPLPAMPLIFLFYSGLAPENEHVVLGALLCSISWGSCPSALSLRALAAWSLFTGSLPACQPSKKLDLSEGDHQWPPFSFSGTPMPPGSQNAMSRIQLQFSCNWGAFQKTFSRLLLSPTESHQLWPSWAY